jgi:hypothetical protein
MMAEGVDDMRHRLSARRTHFIVLTLLVVAVASMTTACSTGGTGSGEQEPRLSAGPDPGSTARERHPELESLVFVRGGSIWAVEEGTARQVIESEAPWSLRDSRSGDAVTYASLAGTKAHIYTAAKGDWRAESMWETDLGSLLVEAVHDDVADVLWFSASGEQTTTIGAREGTGRESAALLPVEVAPHFSVRYEDGALFAAGAAQEPAILYEVGGAAREVFRASTLFYPRLSPDGNSVLVTGSAEKPGRFHLWMVEIADGSFTDLEVGPGAPTDPVWSRDGRHVAFRDATTGTVWIVPAGAGAAADTGLQADEGGLAW